MDKETSDKTSPSRADLSTEEVPNISESVASEELTFEVEAPQPEDNVSDSTNVSQTVSFVESRDDDPEVCRELEIHEIINVPSARDTEKNEELLNAENTEKNIIDNKHSSLIISDESFKEERNREMNPENTEKNVIDNKHSLIVLFDESFKEGISVEFVNLENTEEDVTDINNSSSLIIAESSKENFDATKENIKNYTKMNEIDPQNDVGNKTFSNNQPDDNEENEIINNIIHIKDNKSNEVVNPDNENSMIVENFTIIGQNEPQNSTEIDLATALAALNINCDDKDETFLSCQENFEDSRVKESFSVDANVTVDLESNMDVPNNPLNNYSLQDNVSEENINNSFNIKSLDHTFNKTSNELDVSRSRPSSSTTHEISKSVDNCSFAQPIEDMTNDEDSAVVDQAVAIVVSESLESSTEGENMSSETVKLEDKSPAKSLSSADVSTESAETFLLSYRSLLQASPATFAEQAPKFEKQADLKLRINELEQAIAKLELKVQQKDRIIMNLKMEKLSTTNCTADADAVPVNIDKKCMELSQQVLQYEEELEKAKAKIAELEEKYDIDTKLLEAKVEAYEMDLLNFNTLQETHKQTVENLKQCKEKNVDLILKVEEANQEKRKTCRLLEQSDRIMSSITTNYKELQQNLALEQTKYNNLNTAFEQVMTKYEMAKTTIQGFKNNEEIYKKDMNELQNTLKCKAEQYENFKRQVLAQIDEANKENIKLMDQLKQKQTKHVSEKKPQRRI